MDAITTPVRTLRFDTQAQPDEGARVTSRLVYKDPTGAFRTGFWAAQAGPPAPIAYTMDEFCVLLEGSVRLVDETGHAEVYNAGDSFLIPNGFTGTWQSVTAVRKFFAVFKPG
jgi:uncharacterized cupin superfamily protein